MQQDRFARACVEQSLDSLVDVTEDKCHAELMENSDLHNPKVAWFCNWL